MNWITSSLATLGTGRVHVTSKAQTQKEKLVHSVEMDTHPGFKSWI